MATDIDVEHILGEGEQEQSDGEKTYAELQPVPFEAYPYQQADGMYQPIEPNENLYDLIDLRDTYIGPHQNEIQSQLEQSQNDNSQILIPEENTGTENAQFDSQPIPNQEFFVLLDNDLCNKPRDLYIDKLIEKTNNCEDTIATYRHILAKRAKQSDKFPCGPLCTRRTTKLETCAKRYANDCFALQEFIYDDDPKHLTDVIAKRRTIVKSEPGTPEPSGVIGLTTFKIELAELKSQVLELKATVNELKQEQVKDKNTIRSLENELSKVKTKIDEYKTTQNKGDKMKSNTEPMRSESLFESIRRKDEHESNLKAKAATCEKPLPEKNTAVSRKQVHHEDNEIQVDKTHSDESKKVPDANQSKNENSAKPSYSDKVNQSAKLVQNPTINKGGRNNMSNVHMKSQTVEENGKKVDTENEGEPEEQYDVVQTIGKRNLFLYYTSEGHPRFGRSEIPSDNSEKANPPEHNTPPKKIDVQLTNRNNPSYTKYKSTIKHQSGAGNWNPANLHEIRKDCDQVQHNYTNGDNNMSTPHFESTASDEPIFESVVRRRTIRYYIGNIGPKSNRAGLVQFLKDYGVEPVGVRIIQTSRGCLAAKITVYASDRYTIEAPDIWPKKVYCRRWYGKQNWVTRSNGYNEEEQSAYNVD